jgi:amino acid transporter
MEKTVFVRRTSGLVRPYGAFDTTLIYTLVIFSILNTTLQFPWFWGFWPGADIVGSLAFALIPQGLLAVCYWAIACGMPRSGSDYVWFARITHPALGFAWSLVYWYWFAAVCVLSTAFTYGYTISAALLVWGTLYNVPNLVNFSSWLSGADGSFYFCMVILAIYSIITIMGHKAGKALLYTAWVIQIIALILLWSILGSTDPATFAGKWNVAMSTYVTYQGVFSIAKGVGWSLTPFSVAATIASASYTIFLLAGATQGAGTISGEIRNVNRSIPIALMLANVFAFFIWAFCAIAELHAITQPWAVALSYLWDFVPNKFPLPLPPSMPLMLGIATYPNQMLTLVTLGSFCLANIAFVYVLLMCCSRYFFAWAFDRVMPTRLADVNARYKTPHYAIIATMVILFISAFGFSYYGFSNWFGAGATLMVVLFGLVSLTVVIFPFTKWRTLLDQLPTFMRKRVGIPVISWVGLVTTIIMFYSAYAVTINPLMTSNLNLTAYWCVIFGVAGFVIYYISKWYNKRQGIDISLIFKEIPPT